MQKNEKIYVLHVVGRMDRGGTEALLMNLMNIVDRNRFQFDFVEQTQDECNYDEQILSLGSKIYRAPHISASSLFAYRKWWKNFYNEHPEYKIIHGHSRGSASIYLDEAKKANRVTILHCHSNSHGKGIKGVMRFIWQLPLRNLSEYRFACSYDSGVSQFGKKSDFKVIKNGICSDRFIWNPETRKCKRKEFNIEKNFVIGNVARFEEPKNHKFLLEIFSEIYKMCPEARLMLVGEGSLDSNIHTLAKELGIEDKIIYTGVRSDVNELMQAMDVFVLPSLFEGLGIVNIEAQAAGLTCFVSDKVIPPEVDITDLMHHIPLEASPKEWAEQILEHKADFANRRDTGNEIINSGFDIKSTADLLCNFYEEVYDDGK